jgi:hypothetical protein
MMNEGTKKVRKNLERKIGNGLDMNMKRSDNTNTVDMYLWETQLWIHVPEW